MSGKTGEGPDVFFRVAEDSDRARLIAMINAAFAIKTFLDYERTDDGRLADMTKKGAILLAEDASGELLGSVYVEQRGKRGYLGMLAVEPSHQHSGLGRRLTKAAEDRLRALGCEAVDITVLSLRPELPPIYRRFGYVETGTEPFVPSRALKEGLACHGIVMSKRL